MEPGQCILYISCCCRRSLLSYCPHCTFAHARKNWMGLLGEFSLLSLSLLSLSPLSRTLSAALANSGEENDRDGIFCGGLLLLLLSASQLLSVSQILRKLQWSSWREKGKKLDSLSLPSCACVRAFCRPFIRERGAKVCNEMHPSPFCGPPPPKTASLQRRFRTRILRLGERILGMGKLAKRRRPIPCKRRDRRTYHRKSS